MNNLRVIERLVDMLNLALEIINEQSALLEQHGIRTDDGKLEGKEQQLRDDAKQYC